MTPPTELPVLGAGPRPRSDAVRNRALILGAAERLFRERGVECTSMDAIAQAAGVGKGTLFRRFGDRSSLVRALLEEREAAFQEAFIRGAPPLGPGAPPADRLVAFGHGVLDMLDCSGDLILAAETGAPGVRFRSSVYQAYRTHVQMLVRAGARAKPAEAGPQALNRPELDAGYTADALLAMLGAELVMHQLRGRDVPLGELKDGFEAVARCVVS